MSSPLIKLSKYPPTQRNIKVTLGCNGILRILKRVRVSVIAKQGMLKGVSKGFSNFQAAAGLILSHHQWAVYKEHIHTWRVLEVGSFDFFF